MIAFILNLPYTAIGIIVAIISFPVKISLVKNSFAIVFHDKKFWWRFGYLKYARATTIGNVVLLGPDILKNDLEHELIHVKQHQRYPIIFPILYFKELIQKGYRQNRFEDEAFRLSNSIHLERNKK